MMDYLAWKKRPTPQLVTFLKSGNLDSDEEEEHLQERRINDEVKVLTSAGSNVPLATPVAISTTLPPSVSALSQQGSDNKLGHGRQLPSTPLVPHAQPAQSASIHTGNPTVTSPTAPIQYPMVVTTTPPVTAAMVTSAHSGPIGATAVLTTSTPSSQLQLQLAKSLPDTKPLSVQTSPMCKSPVSSVSHGTAVPVKLPKSPTSPTRRPDTRQQSISAVYDSTIGSKEAIVERAKQEAQVMQRVAELRKEGMWSSRRLPKVQEPPRNKAHWDYLLEEMTWLAADFIQERKWKKACARKLARMVLKYHQDQEQKELRAEKEEAQKLKKIAGQMAKIVKEFWTNIEKVVQYKQQTRLEEKRKKALDMHLNFIVDQTEKYSSWLTEGLHAGSSAMGSSACGSVTTSPEHSSEGGDVEFEPDGTASDDEETIEREENEAGNNEEAEMQELEALQLESELPIEELLKTLPQEVLDEPASLNDSSDKNDMENENDKVKGKESDGEFTASGGEEMDLEETIEEQETHERNKNYKKELDDLEAEGELSIEELRQKYSGAYDSDFDLPEESEDESSEEDSQGSDDDIDVQSDEDSTTEEEEESEEEIQKQEDVGLEFLLKPEAAVDTVAVLKPEPKEQGPGKEITDIAAEAQSLQPKGYTLETTKVETKVPFLLKHSLREYQHVGLDWLATMQEKRLNGILADEMGLGKTIQTIALLAHLACEKGVWGPHLIVVPTSVMLNWEMECKKWCPSFKILTYYGSQKERKQKRQGWTKTNAFHICITSYKLVVQDHQAFRRKKWKYFILDEAQNIKNFKSQRWQMLLNFQSQRRLLLTGTPLQNSLMELWSLMHFLMPNVFQSHREFKEWFSNPLSGMVEGSQDYNDSLVRRLHKVLRPFLLRRLKDDVEKQMPKKYEHVVMCRLSKRQRYLYDEFMSQTKTRETLATGHFMSVINVLMQLRKVCNHPNLFDPRPIVSPFQTEGIVYKTASLVLRALEYDPLKNIDIHVLYPSLADMERDLPAFIAHRVKKLQTPKNLIVEIDSQPDPPARPKPGRLKPLTFRSVSPAASASGRSSPLVPISQARPASPVQIIRTSVVRSATPTHMVPLTSAPSVQGAVPIKIGIVSQHQQVPHITQTSAQAALTSALTTLASSSAPPVQSNIQAKVVPQQLQGVLHTTASPVMPSQPITVQIQQTEQGTRLMIPTGQLSQLPAGLIQIVQTSTGQQLIATSNPAAPIQPVIPVQNVVTSAAAAAGSIAVVPSTPITSVGSVISKMSELASPSVVAATTTRSATTEEKKIAKSKENQGKKKSELSLKSLEEKRTKNRREKLEYISRINKKHCEVKPVYGQDLCDAVDVLKNVNRTRVVDNTWKGLGYVHCHCAHTCSNPYHPDCYLTQSDTFRKLVHTPGQYLEELQDILNRYLFVTPTVMAPRIQMHVSHPSPSSVMAEKRLKFELQKQLSHKTTCLHRLSTKMMVQFPELRLIEYDCGKLQTLDILLHRLKTGGHRVLIFTQMTKMLDVLEAFLSYHGHRYLRLDGTTKVEQRQALMERFNMDYRIFCFILSTRSGGIGVNLTGADTVIFYDSDWNPTMDAQAQDRCHRIGQTRDVHIYRLISEMTIEENILKKANQKRLLGDLAIEGGNFTTAFFKEQTIQELFQEPSGLETLAKEKEARAVEKHKREIESTASRTPGDGSGDASVLAQFEQALCKAEDETDVIAATLVKAEQKAELAEFDETIPWDEREAEVKKEEDEMSKVEMELAQLDKELSPIERYAVAQMEAQMEPETLEELMIAEEDIENSKKDWELARLKALKEEEERRAELEEDEMLYTYSRDDAYNQVKKKKKRSRANKSSDELHSGCEWKPSRQKCSQRLQESKDKADETSPRMQRLRQRSGDGKVLSGDESPGNKQKVCVTPVAKEPAKKVKKQPVNAGKQRTSLGNGVSKVTATPKSWGKLVVGKNNNSTVNSQHPNVNAASPRTTPRPILKVPVVTPPAVSKGPVGNPSPISKGIVPASVSTAASSLHIATIPQGTKVTMPVSPHVTKVPLVSHSQLTTVPIAATVPQGFVLVNSIPRYKSMSANQTPLSPNSIPQAWSNPNLVIRTRRASLQEAQKKDSDLVVPCTGGGLSLVPITQVPGVATPIQAITYNFVKNSVHTPFVNNQTVSLSRHQIIQTNLNQVPAQSIVVVAPKKTRSASQEGNGHPINEIRDTG